MVSGDKSTRGELHERSDHDMGVTSPSGNSGGGTAASGNLDSRASPESEPGPFDPGGPANPRSRPGARSIPGEGRSGEPTGNPKHEKACTRTSMATQVIGILALPVRSLMLSVRLFVCGNELGLCAARAPPSLMDTVYERGTTDSVATV